MERRTYLNEQRGVDGELSIMFDVVSGRMEAVGRGFWSVKQTEAYFHDWCAIVRQCHAAGRPVSVLADLTEGAIQKAEVADIIATSTTELYAEGDAIAMLVPTSLAKMQMRRILDIRYHEFFLSRSAAETWLRGRRLASGTDRPAYDRAV